MNNYEAWLRLGHVDPEILGPHNCKKCGLSYEVFTAKVVSCADHKEAQEIEAKKRLDELESRSKRGWISYGH